MAATKTVKTTDNTGNHYWRVPCNSNPTVNERIVTIPDTWVAITEAEHLASITPCISASVLRIYCPAP